MDGQRRPHALASSVGRATHRRSAGERNNVVKINQQLLIADLLETSWTAKCAACGQKQGGTSSCLDEVTKSLERKGWQVVAGKLWCNHCAEVTCAQCGGELWIGRSGAVCERGCSIFHTGKLAKVKERFPSRKIEHVPFKAALKEIRIASKRFYELLREH